MGKLLIKPGDTILLFREFSYDFEQDLPLAVGPNVYLNKTPLSLLRAADSQLVNLALPGYEPNLSIPLSCLHSPTIKGPPPGPEPTDFFFNSIAALRLRTPLYIEISGQFEVGQDKSIKTSTLYNYWSPWQPKTNVYYSGEDIHVAADIATRLIEVNKSVSRFRDGVILFSQVTSGFSVSLQMCYLALFSVLEFLFGPLKGNMAAVLARRVKQFLSPFDFQVSLQDWLEGEYKRGRSRLIHGLRDMIPWRESRETRYEAFGRLHEIARLAILGFLSFDENKLQLLSKSKEGKELESLGPATGRFLRGQRAWL